MKTRWTRWRLWWRQKAVLGAHHHMTRQHQWGLNYTTFVYLGEVIAPQLKAAYPAKTLKAIRGLLATSSIDELVTDLSIMQRTIDAAGYVDERLVYIHRRTQALHQYLSLMSGPAISPMTAWSAFHAAALAVTATLDLMLQDADAETDRDYYYRRYGSVLEETYRVYQLFAALTDVTLPPLPSS